MGSMAPASSSRQVLSMVVTLSLVMGFVDGVDSSCRPTIKAKQHYIGSLGQPLMLKCIMQFCDPGSPNISLCKITGDRCDPVTSREGINISMEGDEESNAVYVLIFNSLQMNDTGYYQCKAIHNEQRITGNTMKISLSGEISAENIPLVNTTNSGNSTNVTNKLQNFKLLLYIMSSLEGACVFIIIISLLVYCQRQLGGKHKSLPQEPAPTEELQFVAVTGSQGGSPTTKGTGSTAEIVEVTYDNAHQGYKSTTQSASDPDEEDSIVYADLNHNANKTSYQVDNGCEVEYATVQLNESKKRDL